DGFLPDDQVVVLSQTLASAKVSGPRLMFAKHDVHAPPLQEHDIAPTAETAVGEEHVPFAERAQQRAKQRGLARLLSLIATDGSFQHSPHGKRKENDNP